MSHHAMIRWELPAPPDRKTEHDTFHIGLLSQPNDYHCILLASMGMTYACIKKQTGLTYGQIARRLKQAQVRSADYRNGKTAAAAAVMAAASTRVGRIITGEVRKVIDV